MNKTQLIDALTPRFASRADAERALTALLDTIEGAVARDDKVTLPGFGTFERRARAARTARNPQTGETFRTQATHVVGFRAGTRFRERVALGKRGKAATTDAAVTEPMSRLDAAAPAVPETLVTQAPVAPVAEAPLETHLAILDPAEIEACGVNEPRTESKADKKARKYVELDVPKPEKGKKKDAAALDPKPLKKADKSSKKAKAATGEKPAKKDKKSKKK